MAWCHPSALAGQPALQDSAELSLHPGQCPSWQEGRIGLGRGRSYFCNLHRPDSVTRPQTAARGSHKCSLSFSTSPKQGGWGPAASRPRAPQGRFSAPQSTPLPKEAGARAEQRWASPARVSAPPGSGPQPGSSAALTSPATRTTRSQELGWLLIWASQMAQWAKNPPAAQKMQKTWVWSPGREDPLEEEMATHSSVLAWKIQGWGSLEGYSSWGHKELDTT